MNQPSKKLRAIVFATSVYLFGSLLGILFPGEESFMHWVCGAFVFVGFVWLVVLGIYTVIEWEAFIARKQSKKLGPEKEFRVICIYIPIGFILIAGVIALTVGLYLASEFITMSIFSRMNDNFFNFIFLVLVVIMDYFLYHFLIEKRYSQQMEGSHE